MKPALALLALASAIVVLVALRGALGLYDRAFPGLLVDPEMNVSGLGVPYWGGVRAGLTLGDRIVSIDGVDLDAVPLPQRAATWQAAIDEAARRGAPAVELGFERAGERRDVRLALERVDWFAWWVIGGGLVVLGVMYAGAGLITLALRPDGEVARAAARASLLIGAFFATLFDYHTTRALAPLFLVAFAMVPPALVGLALRLPEPPRWALSRRWLLGAVDFGGVPLAAALLAFGLFDVPRFPLTRVASLALAISLLAFVMIVVARFLRASGERRRTLRALLLAAAGSHMIAGLGSFLLSTGLAPQGAQGFIALPAFALTPPVVVATVIRHDLWGSGRVLSRVATRVAFGGAAYVAAVGLMTAIATRADVPILDALFSVAATALLAPALVFAALRAADRRLFASRAIYKPTVAELSESLTVLTTPAAVVEATTALIARWLPTDEILFHLFDSSEGEPGPAGDDFEPAHEVVVLFRGAGMGVIAVGKKRDHTPYTTDDIDLLRTIANQAALALASARAHAEVEALRRAQASAYRDERAVIVEMLAAEIAHEVRYPLNFFRSVFLRPADAAVDAEDREIGREEVERLERLMDVLRARSAPRLRRERTSLRSLIDRVRQLLRDRLEDREIEVEGESGVELHCDADQTVQLFVNLIANGLDATADRTGRVGLSVEAGADRVGIVVWDEGAGFVGDAARVFLPWYTTKAAGTGLGLAIAHRIVRSHGWSIAAERAAGRTRFVVDLPARDVVVPAGSLGEDVA